MLVKSIVSRKVRPVHPGEIIRDILDDRDISIGDIYLYNLELDEILEGDRPITYFWAKEMEKELGISTQLLLNLQRKVDIWDSLYG
jgi:plasmid maintenance system antidote protein VapI